MAHARNTVRTVFSGASAAHQAENHKQPIYGKQKQTHELILSWLSRLAVLLWVHAHDGGSSDDDGGVAQDGCILQITG